MHTIIRKVQESDKERVIVVEDLAIPNHGYLPFVFHEFLEDTQGDFAVAEADGIIVACGKFTVMPDGSAWLETLRVIPSHQNKGIGKLFYERFFELAHKRRIGVMRMYTGEKNAASKGLSERFGFSLDGTYLESWANPCLSANSADFETIRDPDLAATLLMPLRDRWGGHFVMNRTFYEATPSLCRAWAEEGKVFYHRASKSVIALGARFMAKEAVHVAAFCGDSRLCLDFAKTFAAKKQTQKVVCLFPPNAEGTKQVLTENGFQLAQSNLIVMKFTRGQPQP